MGAGKTTTAGFLTERIQQHGLPAQHVSEGGAVRVALSLPHPLAVWSDVTADQYVEHSLALWRTFVEETQATATVTVCDGLLFHGNMTDLLLMDADPHFLRRYVTRVVDCIRGLCPTVVYLRSADVRLALRAVCDARGPNWEAYQVGWKLQSPYATRRALQGFEGLVELYRAYRTLCDDIIDRLDLPTLSILNHGDWPTHRNAMLEFLRLPLPAPPETL